MNLKNEKIKFSKMRKNFLSSFNNFPRRAPAGGPAGMNPKMRK